MQSGHEQDWRCTGYRYTGITDPLLQLLIPSLGSSLPHYHPDRPHYWLAIRTEPTPGARHPGVLVRLGSRCLGPSTTTEIMKCTWADEACSTRIRTTSGYTAGPLRPSTGGSRAGGRRRSATCRPRWRRWSHTARNSWCGLMSITMYLHTVFNSFYIT